MIYSVIHIFLMVMCMVFHFYKFQQNYIEPSWLKLAQWVGEVCVCVGGVSNIVIVLYFASLL